MGQKCAYAFHITGVVQGVGFRPFVYKIALKNGIAGYVLNNTQGVFIHAQGDREALECFRKDLENPPSAAKIAQISSKEVPIQEFQGFSIQKSLQDSNISATIPADIALCAECLQELRDTRNRRFGYALMSCTHCGGRYSLIRALPYDRNYTAMADFTMCETCKAEYNNPNSRRFHSEINCCLDCGPKLFFIETKNMESQNIFTIFQGKYFSDKDFCKKFNGFTPNPLKNAVEALKRGEILAIKGIGGYALVCNGLDSKSIQTLRNRKNRARKPFALMCKDIKMAESYAALSDQQKAILSSPIAPILLVDSLKTSALPLDDIAPNLSTLGIILPYTPLHYLLFDCIDFPLIFTSANISGEPIIKDFVGILENLEGVCDSILLYNRDILNSIDDSLVRTLTHNGIEQMQVLRRARGFLNDITLPLSGVGDFLAFGAQQKVTFCMKIRDKILLSPHLGDLDTIASVDNFDKTRALFTRQYQGEIQKFVLDLHPHYAQRKLIQNVESVYTIQHHFAHLLSNIAENHIAHKVLGVIFDGTGYGSDGKIWGGEFLSWNPKLPLEYRRVAYFDDFVLLGGERAVRENKRLGLALLFESFGAGYRELDLPLLREFSREYLENFYILWNRKQVLCNSVGRLFDGVSALCGICLNVDYEGEAGMLLESFAKNALKVFLNTQKASNLEWQSLSNTRSYPFYINGEKISYLPMVRAICRDLQGGVSTGEIALNFHCTLAQIIAKVAKPYAHIALSGGCFQNALLTQLTLEVLKDKQVYLHKEIPCNDGGISVGQAYYMLLKNGLQAF